MLFRSLKVAKEIGFPVIIKAVAGGGGKGMRTANNAVAFSKEYNNARNEAEKAFGNGAVYLERFLEAPRHIEIQVLGDQYGNVIHLGERDCSVQRRHQKVIEEAPSPFISDDIRKKMGRDAVKLAKSVNYEGAGTVAAFIGEPISAASGIHIPHPEYWPTIREICDRTGVVMICDEVITGFARTGKMFATEHWDVTPDIRTVAKALTSGYFPIGGVMAGGKISKAFAEAGATFARLVTFGGNPPAAAAAHANLDIMESEDFVARSAQMGEYLFEQLQGLNDLPIVGQVRGGLGLLAAVELVKDKATKERFPKSAKLDKVAVAAMRRHRMLGRAADVIPVAPPLCITRDEVDEAVSRLGRVITDIAETV